MSFGFFVWGGCVYFVVFIRQGVFYIYCADGWVGDFTFWIAAGGVFCLEGSGRAMIRLRLGCVLDYYLLQSEFK